MLTVRAPLHPSGVIVNTSVLLHLLEPLSFEVTAVRLESAAAAAEIAGAVAACYERYGYTVVRVPPLPPPSRLAFVLQAAGVFPKRVR